MKKKAVILLSGGLDSTTLLAEACQIGYEPYAISFEYGQRNKYEIAKAKEIAKSYNVKKHLIFTLPLQLIGGSALTSEINVPKDRKLHEIFGDIPVTYVPSRNIIFLSIAVSWGESINAYDFFIGVNAIDYSGYPDCRPEFIQSFEKMINVGTKAGNEGNKITIHTPLLNLSKSEIIKKGLELGVDYEKTISCYDPLPEGIACGRCDSCQLRKKGFDELR